LPSCFNLPYYNKYATRIQGWRVGPRNRSSKHSLRWLILDIAQCVIRLSLTSGPCEEAECCLKMKHARTGELGWTDRLITCYICFKNYLLKNLQVVEHFTMLHVTFTMVTVVTRYQGRPHTICWYGLIFNINTTISININKLCIFVHIKMIEITFEVFHG